MKRLKLFVYPIFDLQRNRERVSRRPEWRGSKGKTDREDPPVEARGCAAGGKATRQEG
jgi:hypothetical protein